MLSRRLGEVTARFSRFRNANGGPFEMVSSTKAAMDKLVNTCVSFNPQTTVCSSSSPMATPETVSESKPAMAMRL
ncbi:hypothetical protein R6Q59_026018 [Mikania micrantha]|uniref:Uncharacterized protein n=1 Tax=Mikania micrantha TaxID=192012 RepID=A0A5N6PCU2_9ASTR|nr:hypothetical protein E3N88_11241 [Mikania micrantha]